MRSFAALLLLTAAAIAGRAPDTSLDAEVEHYVLETELHVVWRGAPNFQSADVDSSISLRSRFLLDGYGAMSDDYPASLQENGIFIRQARLGLAGHLHTNFIFLFEVELSAGSVDPRDMWIGLRDLGGVVILKIGNMRDPFSLDGVTPIPFHMFMERAASGRAFGLGREFAIRLEGAPLDARLAWWLGVFREHEGWGSEPGIDGYSISGGISGSPIRDEDGRRLLCLHLSFAWRRPDEDMARYGSRARTDSTCSPSRPRAS